jgi:beta-N-acetylhexosaminidase
MTLEQKIGQVLMPAFDPQRVADTVTGLSAGCLILWGADVGGPRRMAELANRAQQASLKHRGLPLWIHGYTANMAWDGRWQAALASVASTDEVQRAAAVFGRRWRASGLHNFPGPTLNVSVHDTCIAKSCAMAGGADVVSRYGAAITRGVVSAGCGTMAQHFPAHGATSADSHTDFPVVDLPRDELLRDHIRPYAAAFDAGCTSICTAHLACTALDHDPNHIATTSRAILTNFLRGELGFRGIAIADAIGMKGFQKNGPPEAMSVEALLAGCDSICITSAGPLQHQVFESILAAVRSGYLPTARLDEAVDRNLRFMEWLGLFDDPFVDPDRARSVFTDADDEALLADLDAKLPQSIRGRRVPATFG